MPSKTIDLGVRLHHLDEGSGDQTFVLVHGLGGSHLNWSPLVAPLAKRGRVLVPDLGGFGRTPPSPEGASVEANLALLARFVRAVAPDRRVVLVGNSMGGYLSLRMAADHGALVRALVLVDPAGPTCHTGAPSCFAREATAAGWSPAAPTHPTRAAARRHPEKAPIRHTLE